MKAPKRRGKARLQSAVYILVPELSNILIKVLLREHTQT